MVVTGVVGFLAFLGLVALFNRNAAQLSAALPPAPPPPVDGRALAQAQGVGRLTFAGD